MNKKSIIIFLSHYPFGKGEEFFESEIKFLEESFDNIIFVSQSKSFEQTRRIPINTKVVHYNPNLQLKDLIFYFYVLISKDFWFEVKNIIFKYNLQINIIKIFKNLVYTLINGLKLKKILSKLIKKEDLLEGRDVFLYTYWFDFYTYTIAKLKEKNPDFRAVTRIHGYDLYLERYEFRYLPFRKFVFDRLDSLYFISNHGREYFRNLYKVDDVNKLKVSYLGISNNFKLAKASEDDVFRLISCSFVYNLKRIDLIIRALSEIFLYKIEWYHIGNGEDYNDIVTLANNLLSEKANIRYKFLGHLSNDSIYKFYQDRYIDAFINISSSEGLPVSMMEAASFSIPIIATNVGGVSEIVNSSNGILLSSNPTIDEIVKAINTIKYSNKKQIKNYKDCAYTTWDELFNADKNYKQFYNELLNNNN